MRLKPSIFILLLVVSATGFWSSCTDTFEEFPTDQLELSYFPVEVGRIWTYQVDSVLYSNFTNTTTESTSFIQDEVISMADDVSGEQRYLVQRSWRRSLQDRWRIDHVWFMTRTEQQAILSIDNVRTINLIFPPREGTQWDGNSFIREGFIVNVGGENIEMYKNWNYEIISRGLSEVIGVNSYDEVVQVQQANDENAIELRESFEKYAKGIGLVYKEQRILDTQCIEQCDGQSWEEKAQKGFILTQTLIDHN